MVKKDRIQDEDRLIRSHVLDAVKAFTWDPRVENPEISVNVSGGIVTLSGTVPTHRLYRAALEAACRTKGVLSIEEEIVVG